jgi:hypothetical protein
MKRLPLLAVMFLAATSCGGSPSEKRSARGGSGGESGDGGSGGSGGTGGGAGGMAAKPDALASERDAGSEAGSNADAATDGGVPSSADCTAAAPGTLFCNTLRPLPKTIKETGLFPGAPDFGNRPPSLREYAPDPSLWSDGLEKQRFLLLPQGTKIDNSNGQRWVFPIGTVFIKTFFDEGGSGGKVRPIETRLIRHIAGPDAFVQYDYAVYQWNPAGTDATLLDIEGKRTPVTITIKALGQPFSHDIPSRMDCADCHEANARVAQTFIGFDEVRLNGKLTPASPRTQLEELAALFTAAPPAKPAEILDPDPRLQRIKRFIFGNCVHCHNGGRVVDLHPEMLVANTVGKPIDASGVTAPMGWLRVVPGKPEMSVLYVEARRTMLPTGLKPMPPVGVAVAQQGALDDLKAWISSLPPK